MKRFFKALRRRPAARISFAALIILYVTMIFAEFIAPYSPNRKFEELPNQPPLFQMHSEELGFKPQVQETALINPITREYARVKGSRQAVRFFAKGEPYKLFGFIPSDIHLFTTETEDGKFIPMFLFGSDSLGRDLFSRIVYGSRISLTIGLIGIAISMTLAILIGGLAGFFGGKVDWLLMRLAELFILVPGLYLILLLRTIFSTNMNSGLTYILITVILSFIGWPGLARIIRGMVHSIKREDFVTNAKLEGISSIKTIFKFIIPQITSLLVVIMTLGIPGFILGETTLSYLGLGITDPSVSWGSLINKDALSLQNISDFPWMITPFIYLLITTLSFNFIGDLIRDLSDPYHIEKPRKNYFRKLKNFIFSPVMKKFQAVAVTADSKKKGEQNAE